MRGLAVILFLISSIACSQVDSINTLIESSINHKGDNPIHSILLYIEKADKRFVYDKAFGKLDKGSKLASSTNQFRIASSTKLLVSTIILQLIEEGKLNLHNKASKYLGHLDDLFFEDLHILDGTKFANEITIEQLLSHRTGLADIFSDKEEEFFDLLLRNPEKQYTPKAIVDLFYSYELNTTPLFEPGTGWHYSDMNYVLLGLIIEQIEKSKLSESIRDRILDPLNMQDTYFEFYEVPLKEGIVINQYVGNLNFKEFNTSFDWSGGGLVSTNKDLARFIKGLFDLKLINRSSLDTMTDVKFTKENENQYGLGIYETEYNGNVYYGHYGFYGTYIGYCPETKTVISYSISQSNPDFHVHDFISEALNSIK